MCKGNTYFFVAIGLLCVGFMHTVFAREAYLVPFSREDCEVSSCIEEECDQFLDAIESYDLSTVHQVVQASPYMIRHYGHIALQCAISRGFIDIVDLLLNAEAQVNGQNMLGHTPLMVASSHGFIDIAHILLDAGADVNMCDSRGDTAFVFAAGEGHTHVVQLLLDEGAGINVRNEVGDGALLLASFKGHIDTVRLLLDAGADINECNNKDYTPLAAASLEGHIDVVRLLLDAGAKLDGHSYRKPLDVWSAATEGHADIVDILLDAYELAEAQKNNAFPYVSNFPEGLYPDSSFSEDTFDLDTASMAFNSEPIFVNVDDFPSLRRISYYYVALRGAVYGGHKGIVRKVFARNDKAKEGIDEGDVKGATMLMIAAQAGSIDIVRMLLDAGACAVILDCDMKNAQDHALENGHDEIAALIGNHIHETSKCQPFLRYLGIEKLSFVLRAPSYMQRVAMLSDFDQEQPDEWIQIEMCNF